MRIVIKCTPAALRATLRTLYVSIDVRKLKDAAALSIFIH